MSVNLSIIIPTFNCATVLGKAIESVLHQTYQDWELLLIDGLSTDGTVDLIQEYSKTDKRIRWISETDQGLYDAMNKGVEMAKGEWVYFMGGDDWLFTKNVLSEILDGLSESDAQIDMIRCRVMRNAKPSQIQYIDLPLALHDILNHQSIIYKKHLASTYPFELEYPIAADQVQFMRMIANGMSTIASDVVLANYTVGGASSNNLDLNYACKKQLLVKELFPNLSPTVRYRSCRYAAITLLKYGNFLLGLYWLCRGKTFWQSKREVIYCVKHRLLRLLGYKLETL